MEVKQVLEPRIAALATTKATSSDLKALGELIRQFEREEGVLNIYCNTDRQFHLAIVRATHNDTLMKFMEPIMDMIAEFRGRLAEIPKRRIKANKEHKAIYEAIRSGNARKAQITMQGHVDKIRELLNSLIK